MSDLTAIAHEAAEKIAPDTWIQGAMDHDGAHCAHGWVMACAPQPGDGHLVRAAMRRRGMDEWWNDNPSRTPAAVSAALAGLDVDAALADLWGPAAPAIIRVVRQAGALTTEQSDALAVARYAALATPWVIAGEAAEAVRNAVAAGHAAGHAAGKAAEDAEDAAANAAIALAVAHLVGRHGLTQDHIDTLLAPWISVMGDPRLAE